MNGKAVAALALTLLAGMLPPAQAQNFPVKPVRLLIGFPPGASTDIFGRMIAGELNKAWGQPVLVDNKGGANGIIATSDLAKSPADGHTLMLVVSAHVTNALYYKDLPYDVQKDFAPVTLVMSTPWLLIVSPTLAVNDVKGLIAMAKAKPGQLDYGTAGEGSTAHLTTELLSVMAGTKMNHVPYKGSAQALTDLMGGRLAFMFATQSFVQGQISAKKVKVLGISTLKRTSFAPDIPTIAESGLPGFESGQWFGILAPAGTPAATVRRIQQEVARSLTRPEVARSLAAQNSEGIGNTPEEFTRFLDAEYQKWKKTFAAAGIQPQAQ